MNSRPVATTAATAGRAGRADALQAAYLRRCLHDQRSQLAGEITKRQAEIINRMELGKMSAIGRLRSQIRNVEAELRYLDGLIAGLERRFGVPTDGSA